MIQFIVNGQSVSYEPVENDDLSLLDYIRDTLHLTGTKRGCEEKICGACTVLIDGKATRACHVLVKDMAGKVIETIENLGTPDNLSILQAAFIEYNAVQCGFCTPGIIMAAKGLLDVNTNPSVDEINRALRLNLCRCGTYPRVVQAVQRRRGAAWRNTAVSTDGYLRRGQQYWQVCCQN